MPICPNCDEEVTEDELNDNGIDCFYCAEDDEDDYEEDSGTDD